MFFDDRYDAGRQVAGVVGAQEADFSSHDVVGIARGGVIVANEVASSLGVATKAICVEDLWIDEKTLLVGTSLGSGMLFTNFKDGAVGEFVPKLSEVPSDKVQEFINEINKKYGRLAGQPTQYGERMLLCDDGIVSGRSMITAIHSLRHVGVREIVAVVPVVLPWVVEQNGFPVITWRVTKMSRPATGMFYRSFDDTPDEDVIRILKTDRLVTA